MIVTRRLVLNKENKVHEPVVMPSLERLVSDATTIISNELAFYRHKTEKGHTLTAQESRVIRDYVQSLIALCKEAREQMRMNDLGSLSNEELLALAQQLVLKQQGNESNEQPESTEEDSDSL